MTTTTQTSNPAISSELARKLVNRFLLMEVSTMLAAETPDLITGARGELRGAKRRCRFSSTIVRSSDLARLQSKSTERNCVSGPIRLQPSIHRRKNGREAGRLRHRITSPALVCVLAGLRDSISIISSIA
ncbi:MAG: hypothetical protein R6W76_15415 [Caldilinea sp.]